MREIIEKILKGNLSESHLFLVNVDIQKNRIEVFIDGDCGVNINECAILNRNLHKGLEDLNVDTGDYIIEVSSPGFDRELKDIRSFKKNVGRKIQFRNNQNKYLKGVLAFVNDTGIIVKHGLKTDKTGLTGYSEIREAESCYIKNEKR